MTSISRDNKIDFIKFVGLSLIILAHVHPPFVLFQIRCFDVPLMLFASGLAFSGKSIDNYIKFVLPRTKRLICPLYVFLSVYFALLFICRGGVALEKMACSYMLLNTNTIGYVWIIKVFLLVMLLTPYLLSLNNKLTNRSWWLLICSMLLAVELIACVLPILKNSNKYIYYIIYEIVPFSIAYTIPFMFGLRFRNVHSKVIMWISSLFVAFFICLFIINRFELAPQYKYPPRAIFIIYGVVSSLFLWLSIQNLSKLVNNGVSLFCGQHTIWIYLWHIPMIAIINHYFNDVWFARYILVYVSSIICFYIQYRIVNIIEQKIKSPYWKYLKN